MKIQSETVTPFLVILICCFLNLVDAAGTKVAKKADPNDNKGNTPFLLQDPRDEMCLGPSGFTICDETALWILTKRKGKKTYSLVSLLNPSAGGLCMEKKSGFLGLFSSDQLSIGKCSKSNAKSWEFEFVDQQHVKLSSQGQCVVRGKKKFKNSASLQSCKKGEFVPLLYHPTAVHENGFYIKAADGTCFDGEKFRSCEGTHSNRLLWGVGVKYVWGEAQRYFFGFHPQERNLCLVRKGSKVAKGSCDDSAALQWGLNGGRLTTANGKMCVARKTDNTALLVKCSEGAEFMVMELPTVYTREQLAAMLQNPNLSEAEKEALADAIKKKSALS